MTAKQGVSEYIDRQLSNQKSVSIVSFLSKKIFVSPAIARIKYFGIKFSLLTSADSKLS